MRSVDMTGTAEGVCAFCQGKGTDPYGILSWESTCYVCHGLGTVTVPFPHVLCRYCEGTGGHKTFSYTVCRGRGVVPPVAEPKYLCPGCEGRAYEISSGLECRGGGVVSCEDKESAR